MNSSIACWPNLVKVALMGTHRQSSNLISTMVSGRESSDPSTPSDPSSIQPIQALLTQLDWAEPETAILDAAGAIALHTQAGQAYLFPRAPSPLPPCPPDPLRPLCSPQTTQHLRHGLSHDSAFCAEVLGWLIAYGQRAPDEYLPSLLDFGGKQPQWKHLVLILIGARGRWLACQNPAWEYGQWDWSQLPNDELTHVSPNAVSVGQNKGTDHHPLKGQDTKTSESAEYRLPQEFQTLWQTGAIASRLDLLQCWRVIAPNAARCLLANTWPQESAKHRAILLPALNIGLSVADEPFIDQALSDRSAKVRTIATQLLACLPQSQWSQQMTEWGRSLFKRIPPTISPKTSGSRSTDMSPSANEGAAPNKRNPLQLKITLPTTNQSPKDISNGTANSISIDNRNTLPLAPSKPSPALPTHPPTHSPLTSPPSPQGDTEAESIDVLIQVIGSTALDCWDEYGSPPEVIQSISQEHHRFAVLQGWCLAAIHQCSKPWASALLLQSTILNDFIQNGAEKGGQNQSALTELLQVLPASQREEVLARWLPSATHQQISLLSNPQLKNRSDLSIADQGAANGLAMLRWLQLAVVIQDAQRDLDGAVYLMNQGLSQPGQTAVESTEGPPSLSFLEQWSIDFSRLVLHQLQREISTQIQPYIRELRTLARAIASRLNPLLHDDPIFTVLAERTIPGPAYLDRSWDQSIDIIRSTLAMRQAMQASFQGKDMDSHWSGKTS